MKCHYFLLVTALALFVDVDAFGWDGKAGDEETKKERTVCHRKNETSLQEPRYEMIDDFLLDKYTGNVFYVYVLFSKTEKILLDRESAGSDVVPDHEHVNYQLIVNGTSRIHITCSISSQVTCGTSVTFPLKRRGFSICLRCSEKLNRLVSRALLLPVQNPMLSVACLYPVACAPLTCPVPPRILYADK